MPRLFVVAPALLFAGVAAAQGDGRPNPLDPAAKAPPVGYRSAFEGYRTFADQELSDWRKANDEAGAAGGHAGHKPGQEPGKATAKPHPGKPQSAGGAAERGTSGALQGHGGHK